MNSFSTKQANDYLDEMRKDGWEITHTYNEGDNHYTATKEGYKYMINCREYPHAIIPPTFSEGILARVVAWGPDKIAIRPPLPYNWEHVKDGIHICGFCGKRADKTVRVAFADRSCAECEPEARKQLERPGWCD